MIMKLDDAKLDDVVGGMANPFGTMSYGEAMGQARKLCSDGIDDDGDDDDDDESWSKMNGKDFLRKWISYHKHSPEYLEHKDEIDDFLDD